MRVLKGDLGQALQQSKKSLIGAFNGRSFQQISRGSTLIGAIFIAQAAALKKTELRREDNSPEITGIISTQSAFPGSHYALSISPTDFFADSDSGGFKISIVKKGEETSPNWLSLKPESISYLSSLGGTAEIYRDLHIVGNLAYVASGFDGLVIMDISSPKAPFIVGTRNTPGDASGVAVQGDYAYVADFTFGLQIIDVSKPNKPKIVGAYEDLTNIRAVDIEGNFAYINYGLQIVDVSDPKEPILAGRYPTSADGIQVVESLAYIAGNFDFQIINVTDTNNPTLAGSCDIPDSYKVRVQGNFAYVSSRRGLEIINVTTPSEPILVGSHYIAGGSFGLDVLDNFAYVVSRNFGLEVIDVSDPKKPTLFNSYYAPGPSTTSRLRKVQTVGNFVYPIDSTLGLIVLEETLKLSGIAKESDAGNYEMELVAEDPDQNRASSDFILRVESPPTSIDSILDQMVDVGAPFNLYIDQSLFPDPNSDVIHFNAREVNQTTLPDWLSFSPIGIFSGTAKSSDAGKLEILIEAYDGSSLTSANSTFSLVVNHFPKVLTPLPDQPVETNAPYLFTVPPGTITDQDGDDTLLYNATLANKNALPDWLSFNSTSLQFEGEPNINDEGFYSIILTATDSFAVTASTTFTLTVGEFPALLHPVPDQLASTGIKYLYSLPDDTFSTPPRESLMYSATEADGRALPSWLSFIGPRIEFQGTPNSSDKGITTINVTATDSKGGTASLHFDLNVINTLSEETTRIGASFQYHIPKDMISSPLGPVKYQTRLNDGSPLPSWLTHDLTAQTLSGIPPNKSDGTYNILISADDEVQPPVLGALVINVGQNAAPKVVNPINSQTAQVDQLYNYIVPDNTFADANGDSLTLRAAKINGNPLPAWLTFKERTLSGKPSAGDTGAFSDKTVPVQICASDGDLETCNAFDLAVQGTSHLERALSIVGPLVGISGFAIACYANRGFFINPWYRENYDKGTVNVPADQPFSYSFATAKNEVNFAQAFKGQKMFANIPVPQFLEGRGLLEWMKYDRPISGGNLLPSWLSYNENKNEISSKTGPSQNDIETYTVRLIGDGGVIKEEIRLSVTNG